MRKNAQKCAQMYCAKIVPKMRPEANSTLVLVELIVQLVPAAIFVLKMAVCSCRATALKAQGVAK